jgi:AcrR family transcriptional regulator
MASEVQKHLLKSARKEIEEFGVLDFRVSRVASDANCSITQIYRYFGNRNGLVANALSDLYNEILDKGLVAAETYVSGFQTMTIDDVLAMFLGPTEMAQMPMMPVRLQILAVASTIPELEEQLSEISKKQFVRWLDLIEEIRSRLPSDTFLDERVVTFDLVMLMPYYARLLGASTIPTDEYLSWVRHKLFPNQRSH